MKNLVIVESPTKARTIGRFLGSDYEVIASMGHIYDLPKSTLGVDTEHNFEPQYELMKDKKKILDQLKDVSKKADRIILATDLDREGEAIAYHIAKSLSENPKSEIRNPKFDRIVFHEITSEAIDEALKNPREVDKNLVDAQTARRVLDRLVGYKLSPLLWSKVRRGLSAGRVQSVALRLIVEREKEIEKFKKEPFYTISVKLKGQNSKNGTDFELIKINGEKIESTKKINLYDGEYKYVLTVIDNENKAKEIEADLKNKDYIVSDVSKKEVRRTPPPPYTTSTLQQDGARRMGLSGKRTMSVAQKLYEEGYITYHRTDSVMISEAARKNMSDYVKKEFGEKYISNTPRYYKNNSKNAQEAHEAIRPAKIGVRADDVTKDLGLQFGKLYEMIWRRALATQMADAITEATVVEVDGGSGKYTLKANGSVLLFEGFLKINPYALDDRRLPEFSASEKLEFIESLSEWHETLPPPRYNDASIIKTLEEKGIGRPSTYATIISTIESRGYIEREESRFKPTPVGIAVNDFLVANFSAVDDIPFTAAMEDELDLIATGEKKWVPVIADFYKPFEETLVKVKDVKRIKIKTESTGEKCPECKKGDVVVRSGRFGKFLSCSNFPECKYTAPYVEETKLICPKDKGKIVIKKTKKGRKFYGCGNYPNCDFAAWKMEDIKKEQKVAESTNV
jgi:DNA topoisomerase I